MPPRTGIHKSDAWGHRENDAGITASLQPHHFLKINVVSRPEKSCFSEDPGGTEALNR